MRKARVRLNDRPAGVLSEDGGGRYRFSYDAGYDGAPVSLTMPVRAEPYTYNGFPPFFDGLLPEGFQLDALLRTHKIDKDDLMGQLLAVGGDLVGAVTVEPIGDAP